jgi:hypothetical protein
LTVYCCIHLRQELFQPMVRDREMLPSDAYREIVRQKEA